MMGPTQHRARALDLELPVDEYIGDLGEESLSDCFGAKLVAAHEDETKLAVNIRNDLFEM
jgi:hypothetical protein